MKTIVVVVSLILTGASVCRGALITTFSFTGATGKEASYNPDYQPAGATVTAMTRGSGLATSYGAQDAFNANGWTTSATRDESDYYTFTISPNSGYKMTLTRLELDERRSDTGIRQWAIYSSLDNYQTSLAAFSVPDNTDTRADQGANLNTSFANLTDGITFRIYAFASEGSSGTWRIDNVDLSGTVEAVPEPVNVALVVFGGIAGTAWAVRRFVFRRKE